MKRAFWVGATAVAFAGIFLVFQNQTTLTGEDDLATSVDTTPPPNWIKKGIGTTGGLTSEERTFARSKINALKAKWYYTWGLKPIPGVSTDIQFVPMIWSLYGEKNQEETISKLSYMTNNGSKKFPFILLFNEPDKDGQADVTEIEAVEFILKYGQQLRTFTDKYISPSSAGGGNLLTGKIGWLDTFLNHDNLPDDFITRIGYHHYPDPIREGYIPVNANPDDLNDPFYSDTTLVNSNVQKFAADFMNRLLQVRRRYPRKPIWITEFGVADWCYDKTDATEITTTTVEHEEGDDNINGYCGGFGGGKNSNVINRVRPAFVLKFLKHVLPNLYTDTHIGRFAYYSIIAEGERLRTSAIFDSYDPSTGAITLTDVGTYYANYAPKNNCYRGEFYNKEDKPDRIIEYRGAACGIPEDFKAGWREVFIEKKLTDGTIQMNKQYRRSLTLVQAGHFDLPKLAGCYRRRHRKATTTGKIIIDSISANCYRPEDATPRTDSGWILNGGSQEYQRTINPATEKVSSMWTYYET